MFRNNHELPYEDQPVQDLAPAVSIVMALSQRGGGHTMRDFQRGAGSRRKTTGVAFGQATLQNINNFVNRQRAEKDVMSNGGAGQVYG